MGELVTQSDDRAFDTYLYLIKEYDLNKKAKVILKYQNLQSQLGMDGMTNEDSRRQINKTLRKLQDKYKLIDIRLHRGEDAEVILKDLKNPNELYKLPESKFLQIPHTYWTYNWSKTLDLSSKTMYLLGLGYSGMSKNPPSWYKSVKNIANTHHVSEWFVSKGTMNLRRLNLIEVQYDELDINNLDQRDANTYYPNPLYNPETHKQHLIALQSAYGKTRVESTQKILELLIEDHDYNALETLIKLQDKYPPQILNDALIVVSSKREDNPKRSVAYYLGVVKTMAEEADNKTTEPPTKKSANPSPTPENANI